MNEILFFIVIFGCFSVFVQPGEILSEYARLFLKAPKPIQKLMTCPYCLAGQFSFWYYLINGYDFNDVIMFTGIIILSVFIFNKIFIR